MAIAITNLTASSSGVNASSYATASITPTAGGVLLSVSAKLASGTIVVPTISGGGGTWLTEASNVAVTRGNWIFSCVNFSGSGAITIDFGAQSIVYCFWSANDVTGHNTADMVVAVPTPTSGTGTTGTVTFAALADANNAQYAHFFHLANEATAPEADGVWAELSDVAAAYEDSVGQEAEWRIGSDTSATATWATSAAWRGQGVEVAIAPAVGTTSRLALMGVG